MRVIQTFFACFLSAVCLAGRGADAAEGPHPLTVALAFDRPINAISAPLVVAITDGLFSSEGLAVLSSVADGSPQAIARVASGASEFAVVDINALIRFRGHAKRGHPCALGHRGQDARHRRQRPVGRAVAGARAPEQDQSRSRQAKPDQCWGTRANTVLRGAPHCLPVLIA